MSSRTHQQTHSGRSGWCCVQAGHREQYGIPRALERAGVLDRLVTDLWMPPTSWLARLPLGRIGRRMGDRYHPELPARKVTAFSGRALAWEARSRSLQGNRVLAHNAWWSALAAAALRQSITPSTRYVFNYCYNAGPVFAQARQLGLIPVLGQIDPGLVEDNKVREITQRWPEYVTTFAPGTPAYYDAWREECSLAGHILVNSVWSRTALIAAGIDEEKITVCPLVYTPPAETHGWKKTYPRAFSRERPLRVLFLGQCILRKGLAETIAAAQALAGQPVEFTLVGNTDVADLPKHFGGANVRYVPRVSRVECQDYFRRADVFLFPTHSDGFGLTQLEAQAWKLPIIASQFCGEVVQDGRTGWVLPEVSAAAIVAVLEDILAWPAELAACSAAITPWPFGLQQLGERLVTLDQKECVSAWHRGPPEP